MNLDSTFLLSSPLKVSFAILLTFKRIKALHCNTHSTKHGFLLRDAKSVLSAFCIACWMAVKSKAKCLSMPTCLVFSAAAISQPVCLFVFAHHRSFRSIQLEILQASNIHVTLHGTYHREIDTTRYVIVIKIDSQQPHHRNQHFV